MSLYRGKIEGRSRSPINIFVLYIRMKLQSPICGFSCPTETLNTLNVLAAARSVRSPGKTGVGRKTLKIFVKPFSHIEGRSRRRHVLGFYSPPCPEGLPFSPPWCANNWGLSLVSLGSHPLRPSRPRSILILSSSGLTCI